jgi:hypothetical protein
MGLPQDFSAPAPSTDSTSPLSKRRRFTPNVLPPIIPVSDNSAIENHTFDSPLLLQLCEQTPDQAEIEAGLLQVGMRVRKAVAEGYKTQPKRFTPRPFFDIHRLSAETQAALSNGNTATASELSPYAASEVQPMSTATFCGVSLSFLSNYPDDWSNQAIAQQSLWSYSTSHKRGHEVDSDSDESQDWQPQTPSLIADSGMGMPVDYLAIDTETMSDVSPMVQIGDHTRQHFNGRRIAMPKTRGRPVPSMEHQMQPAAAFNPFSNFAPPQPEPHFASHSGHRRMVSCGMEAMDFGDASFLQRREDVEMDCS